MKFFFILAIVLSCAPAVAQKPIDWTLTGADVAVRTLDAYSTRRFLQCSCNQELMLPRWIVKSNARMYGYSLGVAGVNFLVARSLEKHHHAKLARVLRGVEISYETTLDVNNLRLRTKP